MYWDRGLHLSNVDIHVPVTLYFFIGNTTPLTTESTNTYASVLGNGYIFIGKLKWQEIPKERDYLRKQIKQGKKFHLQEMSAVFLNTLSMTSGRLLKTHRTKGLSLFILS